MLCSTSGHPHTNSKNQNLLKRTNHKGDLALETENYKVNNDWEDSCRNKLKGMEAQTSKGIIFIVAQDIVSAN